MNEKDVTRKANQENLKLEWEAPKLYCLDKGNTNNGTSPGTPESTTLTPGS